MSVSIGDLICFNVGGQRNKTLGLVLGFDIVQYPVGIECKVIMIQWCIIGDLMPRRQYRPQYDGENYNFSYPQSGDIVWHEFGDWFEVVK